MIEFYAYVLVKRQLYVQFSEYGCGCILKEKPEYDYESLIKNTYIKNRVHIFRADIYQTWKVQLCS